MVVGCRLPLIKTRNPRANFVWKIIRPRSTLSGEPLPWPGDGCTGTWPDSLANHADQKSEGSLGNVLLRKLRNSQWAVGVRVHIDSGRKLAQVLKPNTNAQGLPLLSHLLRSAWNPLFILFVCLPLGRACRVSKESRVKTLDTILKLYRLATLCPLVEEGEKGSCPLDVI